MIIRLQRPVAYTDVLVQSCAEGSLYCTCKPCYGTTGCQKHKLAASTVSLPYDNRCIFRPGEDNVCDMSLKCLATAAIAMPLQRYCRHNRFKLFLTLDTPPALLANAPAGFDFWTAGEVLLSELATLVGDTPDVGGAPPELPPAFAPLHGRVMGQGTSMCSWG